MHALLILLTICALSRESLACQASPPADEPGSVEAGPVEPGSVGRRSSPNQRLLGAKRRMTRAEIDDPDFQALVQKSLQDLQSNACVDYDLVEVQEATKQVVNGNKYEWKMKLRPRPSLTKLRCPPGSQPLPASDAVDAAGQMHHQFQSSAWVRPWLKEEAERHTFNHTRIPV